MSGRRLSRRVRRRDGIVMRERREVGEVSAGGRHQLWCVREKLCLLRVRWCGWGRSRCGRSAGGCLLVSETALAFFVLATTVPAFASCFAVTMEFFVKGLLVGFDVTVTAVLEVVVVGRIGGTAAETDLLAEVVLADILGVRVAWENCSGVLVVRLFVGTQGLFSIRFEPETGGRIGGSGVVGEGDGAVLFAIGAANSGGGGVGVGDGGGGGERADGGAVLLSHQAFHVCVGARESAKGSSGFGTESGERGVLCAFAG